MRIVICLRNLDTSPCKIIVEAIRDIDIDNLDPQIDLTEMSGEEGAFEDFVQRVREALPIKEKNVDVYIGWWGDQSIFRIPQNFFDLIAETKWPVTFDIND